MIIKNIKAKKYQFNKEDAIKINDFLIPYKADNFRIVMRMGSEDIKILMNEIEVFLNNIKEIEVEENVQIHETQEEAREYFGDEFIKQFDKICDDLLKENIFLLIHGTTDNETAEEILKTGLRYRTNIILRTSCALPKIDEEVDYESLLNWPHNEFKSLVLIAIPNKAIYEGMWEEQGDNYVITKDFIYGYIDVNNKKIILNDNYRKTHDYTNKILNVMNTYLQATNKNEEEDYHFETKKTDKVIEINNNTMLINLQNSICELFNEFNTISNKENPYMEDDKLIIIKEYLNELKYIYNYYLEEEEMKYFI